jgi:hypothetical protein
MLSSFIVKAHTYPNSSIGPKEERDTRARTPQQRRSSVTSGWSVKYHRPCIQSQRTPHRPGRVDNCLPFFIRDIGKSVLYPLGDVLCFDFLSSQCLPILLDVRFMILASHLKTACSSTSPANFLADKYLLKVPQDFKWMDLFSATTSCRCSNCPVVVSGCLHLPMLGRFRVPHLITAQKSDTYGYVVADLIWLLLYPSPQCRPIRTFFRSFQKTLRRSIMRLEQHWKLIFVRRGSFISHKCLHFDTFTTPFPNSAHSSRIVGPHTSQIRISYDCRTSETPICWSPWRRISAKLTWTVIPLPDNNSFVGLPVALWIWEHRVPPVFLNCALL